MVRHGRATGGWDDDPDPGLDDLGRHQALRMTDIVAPLGPWPILCSPLRRTRETAIPLAERWQVSPEIDIAVAEIPSPVGVEIGQRVDWLRMAMAGSWADLDERYRAWRDAAVARVAALSRDTVVVSHFIAINAVIGACTDDDRVVIRSLDNCSRTEFSSVDGVLRLVEGGHEADTLIR
jgi:broad specificity phosphatase PhoE